MSESNLWQRMRENLAKYGHLQRIETGVVAAGVPDVNYCFDGIEGWVELKCGVVPKREMTVVFKSQHGLSPEQIEWLLYRRRCGGRCYVLIQLGKVLFLLKGSEAGSINSLTMSELSQRSVYVGKDWKEIKKSLTF